MPLLHSFPSASQRTSRDWLHYFEHNQGRAENLPWHLGVRLPDSTRAALIRTLQRFHLGESGDGEFLRRFAAQTGDADYECAIALFIAEENEHSRWFGQLLDELEARHLSFHWSDAVFTKVRRAGGLSLELMTFLVAEICGKRLFRAIAQSIDDPLTRAVFAQIVRDERAHIAFHLPILRATFASQSRARRASMRWLWSAILGAALVILSCDQAALFRELGLSRRAFWRDCFRDFQRIGTRVFANGQKTNFS